MFENSEREDIGFRSDRIWATSDLANFASSVTNIYNAFLSVKIKRGYEKKHREFFERYFHDYYKLQEHYFDHPFYIKFLDEWKELLQKWSKRFGPYPPPPFFPFPFPPMTEPLRIALPEDYEIYQKVGLYSGENDLLRVERIMISSPGGFSFNGIAEIVGQIRGLIKDLWYGNRQEKVMGDLEIIEKYLQMRSDYPDENLPPLYSPASSKLIEIVAENVIVLRVLEKDGKLKSIPENLDYKPEK